MVVVSERWAGNGNRLLYLPSSTSFSSCLGCSNVGHWGLQADSHPGILSPTGSNWLKPPQVPGYIIVSRPPTSAVLPLIYTGASLDWWLGQGSICYNHLVLIFQNSTCGIFLHVRLHPPHTHILQIMLKDNNSKNTKRN